MVVEWFGATPFQTIVGTGHAVSEGSAVHSFATYRPWSSSQFHPIRIFRESAMKTSRLHE